ncbi:MAG: sensor histidine kinase [Muribaculaceae bacterium]|nr:sensor histidine kinase [Muribaculaceae bacterium]
MKRLFAFVILIISIATSYAQNSGSSFRTKADEAMAAKEYVKARYLYLKAYQAFVNNSNTADAIPCAVNVASLYHRENYYKEAFEILSSAERFLNSTEESSSKTQPALHYPIDRERQRMYLKLRNTERANEQLSRMKGWAEQASDSTLTIDLLSASAQQYYSLGLTDKGDAAVNSLIAFYQRNSDFDKAGECYKDLINMANNTGSARLISRAYDKYISWSDSIAGVKSDARVAAIQQQLDQANADIADRDSSLTTKTATIIGLCILAAILAGALIFVSILLLRYIALSRRQSKQITTLQSHNELKTRFISNITTQMKPTLDTLPQSLPAVQALHSFVGHIQELSNLESTLTNIYPTESTDITAFCRDITESIKDKLAPDVKMIVDTPKMTAPISQEPLTHVLTHLLNNAALHTPSGGKICLEVKKRGPHNIQFIITDTGTGMTPEKQNDLFIPFATVRDLTKGDGLGLPICSLMTIKMKGNLRLDETYTNGTRFIMELRP